MDVGWQPKMLPCEQCQQRSTFDGGGLRQLDQVRLCRGGQYQGSLRQLILRAKASPDSPAFRSLYKSFLRQVTAADVVPEWITVPPPSWRRRWQGWHLAEELAQKLARDLGCNFQRLLRRRKHRPAQAGLGAHARRGNLLGAFDLLSGAQRRLPPSLWIVDDVWTTGATFYECQRVLEKAGVHVHGALLLAQVDSLQEAGSLN